MKQFLYGRLALLLCLFVGLVASQATAQNALSIDDETTAGISSVPMTVRMDSDADVQGFVLAISYDNSLVEVTGVDVDGVVFNATPGADPQPAGAAELVVGETFHAQGGFTLGVVLDASPDFGGQVIPAGVGQHIATFDATPLVIVTDPDPAVDVVFTFTDGTFNSPTLDNILVQGGLSVGAGQGLSLNSGTLTLDVVPPGTLKIESTSIVSESGNVGDVRILMDNGLPVQGFVLAIANDDTKIWLEDADAAGIAEAVGAEFVEARTNDDLAGGGTLGVVLDFFADFEGQTIAPGSNQHIATFSYSCNEQLIVPAADETTDLTFVNGVLGAPALDNVLVAGGLSINPLLENGTFTCEAFEVSAVEFFCGDENSADGIPSGLPGDTVNVCFWYVSEENLQGFQLAVCFSDDLTFANFNVENTISDEVGAEFVNYNIDNDSADVDGDGREMVAGILLDVLPPFDPTQTVPPTATPLMIGCVEATISEDAECDAMLDVTFCNGINGAGDVMIENIVIMNLESFQQILTNDCAVHVAPVATFKRGDCNRDDKVDLADAATMIAHDFFDEAILCPDACDANDDGKINLADPVRVMDYLFKFGAPPAAPGPDAEGDDETPDTLGDCDASC